MTTIYEQYNIYYNDSLLEAENNASNNFNNLPVKSPSINDKIIYPPNTFDKNSSINTVLVYNNGWYKENSAKSETKKINTIKLYNKMQYHAKGDLNYTYDINHNAWRNLKTNDFIPIIKQQKNRIIKSNNTLIKNGRTYINTGYSVYFNGQTYTYNYEKNTWFDRNNVAQGGSIHHKIMAYIGATDDGEITKKILNTKIKNKFNDLIGGKLDHGFGKNAGATQKIAGTVGAAVGRSIGYGVGKATNVVTNFGKDIVNGTKDYFHK